MADNIQSPKQHRRPPPLPPLDEPFDPVIDNTICVWLDKCKEDFEKFRERFCTKSPVHPKQWLFFEETTDCSQFIAQSVIYPKKVILVTSGSLGKPLIENLHNCDQLDSIYIYCQDLQKYKDFSQPYKKILGVYSNPVEIFSKLREYLDKKSAQTPTPLLPTNISLTSYDELTVPWTPWQKNNGTEKLRNKEQLIVSVIQNDSIPFELILSNASKYIEINGEDKYSIILSVDKREIKLTSYINDQSRVLYQTDEYTHILQSNENHQEYTYWMSFSKDTLTINYGFGEIRPKFQIFEFHLDNKDRQSITNLSYLHVKINGVHRNFSTINHLKDKIRFLCDYSSFIEPNLLVLPQSQISLINKSLSSSTLLSNLVEPCRALYHNLTHFKLDDEDFPDLIEAIEYSIANSKGWCYQKLLQNADLFGRTKKQEKSYIRLNLQSIIIEIWPPGHYSPIHNHKKAYGIFRVLHGSILIRLYPGLITEYQYETPIEYILHKDQITWMMPKLNQTHQMKNVELNSCSIIAQLYKYDEDEKRKDEEIFDYIDNNGRSIKTMKPTSDMDFGKFKDLIRKEWNERNSM